MVAFVSFAKVVIPVRKDKFFDAGVPNLLPAEGRPSLSGKNSCIRLVVH